jgi:hypothetical protein
MPLPSELIQTITIAKAAMWQHPAHQLLPVHRRAIYHAMGENEALSSLRVRGQLALLSAQYVLPIWLKARSSDHLPENTIKLGEDLWHRRVAAKTVDGQLGDAWKYFEQLAYTSVGSDNVFFAGFAAVKAVSEVLGRDQFKNTLIDEEATDQSLDPWSSDTAAHAAAAYGGPVWIAVSDISRRKDFWEWWLDVAVPAAWQACEGANNAALTE